MERIWLISYGFAWMLILVHGLCLFSLFFTLGRIYLLNSPDAHALITDEGPEIHSPMPPVKFEDPSGHRFNLRDYSGREVILLLLSPNCSPCQQLLSHVETIKRKALSCPDFLAVMESSPCVVEQFVSRYGLKIPIFADEEATVRTSLGVERTPYAFLLDGQGIVRMKGIANTRGQLEALIHRRGRHMGNLVGKQESMPPYDHLH